ncbi:hypothetical protein PF005_g5977 [Phytophthora fragariae]|uniref:Uncharacterized protein n=1 Tax=Phytophthora fragariae TaxID=53985 RepID=A0A6A3T1X7_9STRA|nr:hypothetical protein PF010_g5289 [Phytophthora fragariae]KAE9127873.1 hypothetical protein PF007_g5454 [Phytophthora fragariae]KAE9224265.1 hypothetical protein PF005_g5977 [Phytophthora fragariae]KAE9246255.1 hypothetical protein PF004_g4887 [Phytophthora fragariae]KAE9320729.1 hypothetical protein PF001_g5262 [Phytophthora fragariae]
MGYRCCRGYGLPRPSEAEWRQITKETPLSESERAAVGRSEAALSEARRGAPPRRLEEPNPARGFPCTPLRSPELPREGQRAAPSYPTLAQANAQGIDDAMVLRRRGDEHRDPSAGQHERHRAAGWPPQYTEHYPHRRQEADDHHARTERDRWQDAKVAQRLNRLAHRLDVLEHENQELRRRVPQRQSPQRGQGRDAGEWQRRRWE